MKRLLIPVLFLLSLPLSGKILQNGLLDQTFQKGLWDVRIGTYGDFSYYRRMDVPRSEYRLSDIYTPYVSDISSSAPLYASATWQLNKLFSFGLASVYERSIGTITDPMTSREIGEKTENKLLFIPKAQLNYFCWKWGGFYGSVSAGAAFYFGKDAGKGYIEAEPFLEAVPYGLWLGGKFYFYEETFFGTTMQGVRMGVGYRF